MKALKNIISIIDKMNNWIGNAVSWLIPALMVLVGFDVLRRQLFNQTDAWILELEWHLFAMVFLLGAGYTFLHDRHVRVDVFYSEQSPRDKAWVNLVGILALLIPWILILIYWGTHYAWQSFEIGEGSPNPNGLPARYLIKFAIPLGLLFLLLQGVSELAKSILVIKSTEKKH